MHGFSNPEIVVGAGRSLHATGILRIAKRQYPTCHDPLFSSVRTYIKRNISRRIKVQDLARLTQLSPFQLLRVFQREYAITPYALVLEIRIERAKELLKSGISIAEVAVDTGFSDQSHLTRHFRRHEGTTPKVFLANHAAGLEPMARK